MKGFDIQMEIFIKTYCLIPFCVDKVHKERLLMGFSMGAIHCASLFALYDEEPRVDTRLNQLQLWYSFNFSSKALFTPGASPETCLELSERLLFKFKRFTSSTSASGRER